MTGTIPAVPSHATTIGAGAGTMTDVPSHAMMTGAGAGMRIDELSHDTMGGGMSGEMIGVVTRLLLVQQLIPTAERSLPPAIGGVMTGATRSRRPRTMKGVLGPVAVTAAQLTRMPVQLTPTLAQPIPMPVHLTRMAVPTGAPRPRPVHRQALGPWGTSIPATCNEH